jgi:large subunit ribosomal protein L18
MSAKQEKRARRHKKIRKSIYGTKDRPRLCVFRSNQHIYAQLIDDDKAKVLISVSDMDLKTKKPASAKGSGAAKSDVAKEVGKLIAKKAVENKIEKVVFDRGGIIFHGRIKALADGAREGGLKF